MTGDPKPFDAVKFAAGVRDLVERAVRPLAERVAALEQAQNKSLNLADAFAGSWQPNHQYARGQLVVHHASLWLALESSGDRPGSSAAWRLVTKGARE